MNKILVVLIFSLLPASAFARGDSGHMGPVILSGYYGLGFVNPADINGLSTALNSNPKVGNVSSDTIYGGSLAFMLGWHWDLKFRYDQQDAKNYVSTNLNSNTGFEIQENNLWATLDYYLIHNRSAYVTLGGGAGYPTYFHVTEQTATTAQYNGAYNVDYIGQVVIGIMLGAHLSLCFEGAYQKLASGNLTNSASVNLANISGAPAVADLSGFRADAGLSFHF